MVAALACIHDLIAADGVRGGTMFDGGSDAAVHEGVLTGGLPYRKLGSGPPVMVFPGLAPTNALTTGMDRMLELWYLRPLARRFTVYSINRRSGLAPNTTIADLAADYAHAIADAVHQPVDVIGFSTGGHIAQQFAIDHPHLVRRLVLAATAYRLSGAGWEATRRCAAFAAVGDARRAMQAFAPAFAAGRVERRVLGWFQWITAPWQVGRAWDPSDMVATLRADLAFNVKDKLKNIDAPTLVIGGTHDPSYPPALVQATAQHLPHSRWVVYRRSHLGVLIDGRLARDVGAFLLSDREALAV